MPRSGLFLLALVLAALVAPSVQHAYMAFPPSRNYQAYAIPPDPNKFDCPHCGNGGGIGHQPSMCGDPYQNVVGNSAFVPFTNRFYATTTFKAGATINVQIVVSTNHGGRMSLAICPLPRDKVTPECFKQPQNMLRRVDSNPEYNNKWYWYLNTGNMVSAQATYKLPDGVTCENGCMLQWWWMGYQACTMPCEDPSVDVPSECAKNPINPPVGRCSGVLATEQFYNCADIVITASGASTSSAGVVTAPTMQASPPAQVSSPPAKQSPPAALSPSIADSPPAPTASPATTAAAPAPPTDSSTPSSCDQSSPASPPPPSDTCTPPSTASATTDTTATATAAATTIPTKCSPSDWRCDRCSQRAAMFPAAAGLGDACYSCATTDVKSFGACWQCLSTSNNADILQGCLDCVMKGTPAWQCQNLCARRAKNAAQMDQCLSCIRTPGINTWGCGNCFDQAGGNDPSTCLNCVAAGMDGWACGQCASKSNSAACYQLLASAWATNMVNTL